MLSTFPKSYKYQLRHLGIGQSILRQHIRQNMLFLQFIFMDVKQNVEEQLEFVYVLIDF